MNNTMNHNMIIPIDTYFVFGSGNVSIEVENAPAEWGTLPRIDLGNNGFWGSLGISITSIPKEVVITQRAYPGGTKTLVRNGEIVGRAVGQ